MKRTYKTLDSGEFNDPPAKARRRIFLSDKLKVVQKYKELQKERDEARAYLKAPRRMEGVHSALEMTEKKRECREILKRNINMECKQLYPDIVGPCQVWKWAEQCEREGWESIPETDLVSWTEVPGLWRQKMGLKKKGRDHHSPGSLPSELLVELDHLVYEHSNGASDISERKQVVTTQDVESWIELVCKYIYWGAC